VRGDAAYAEAILFDYEPDWIPVGLELIERQDLLACRRRGWPASHSRVAYARWDDSMVERGIDEVLAFLRKPFRSIVVVASTGRSWRSA